LVFINKELTCIIELHFTTGMIGRNSTMLILPVLIKVSLFMVFFRGIIEGGKIIKILVIMTAIPLNIWHHDDMWKGV
jgi:hypothetical protein